MARLIPSHYEESVKSPGEKELFLRLRNDPLTKDWIVMHSVDVAHHKSRISGEVDFLIIIPNKGVLCLEIKAHQFIKREGGNWYLGKDSNGKDRSPFKQVSETMHSLRCYLSSRHTALNDVPFFSAVCFTSVEFTEISPEWRPWQCISSRFFRTRGIGAVIIDLCDRELEHYKNSVSFLKYKKEYLNAYQIEILLSLLRPPIELSQSPVERLLQHENELIRYTEEQFKALDAAHYNERLLFVGPAGTGKTVLAIEAARRLAISGKKVLFLCYSKPLSLHIGNLIGYGYSNIKVMTIHGLMASFARITKYLDTPEFWKSVLPELALEAMLGDNNFGPSYDALIVDEAQDISSETLWLDVLELILKSGLAAGIWQMFGDFKGQALFSDGKSEQELIGNLRQRASDISIFPLTINCRNRKSTVEQSLLIGRMNGLYSMILRSSDNEITPEYKFYESDQSQQNALKEAILSYLKRGYPPSSMIVLSPKRDGCAAQLANCPTSFSLRQIDECEAKDIAYTTIHGFKGMERPIVFITDIVDLESTQSRMLLYTATTRSTESFTLFLSQTTEMQLAKLVMESK
ncbi:DUF2075 domain-containing protein [Cellvibrio sp. KY-GH-1]|uniref:nuclease-related domain-containing DEAD/DEAH box helicase n=1 Tax=Cellvibrio sp. KY-GH-1 TaxID=2303332 RepID=UPI001247B379|nr:NERD domain-containing protein [Cellvibrio sp. KY-GH-1]QEY17665.1 DUF2075 domain-containing protein [Cellvibrio sp. KY-GH-1]